MLDPFIDCRSPLAVNLKRALVERAWMMFPSVAAELAARYLFEAVDSMKPLPK